MPQPANQSANEDPPISARKFVAIALFTWAFLAVATALIIRLTYAAFGVAPPKDANLIVCKVSICLPPVGFDHWHWLLKALFLAVTLAPALWVAWAAVSKPVDSKDTKPGDDQDKDKEKDRGAPNGASTTAGNATGPTSSPGSPETTSPTP